MVEELDVRCKRKVGDIICGFDVETGASRLNGARPHRHLHMKAALEHDGTTCLILLPDLHHISVRYGAGIKEAMFEFPMQSRALPKAGFFLSRGRRIRDKQTDHVGDAVGDRVFMLAVRADHNTLLYMDLRARH